MDSLLTGGLTGKGDGLLTGGLFEMLAAGEDPGPDPEPAEDGALILAVQLDAGPELAVRLNRSEP